MDSHGKSPESSDCEGYATPLASSLTDLADSCNKSSGELTPVSSRAISPACVREIMYLQKSGNLVVTQRMLSEEDIRRLLELASEEEFFDTADEHVESDESDADVIEAVTECLLEKVADIEPVIGHMEVVHVEENADVLEEVPVEVEGELEIAENTLEAMEIAETSEQDNCNVNEADSAQESRILQDSTEEKSEDIIITPEVSEQEKSIEEIQNLSETTEEPSEVKEIVQIEAPIEDNEEIAMIVEEKSEVTSEITPEIVEIVEIVEEVPVTPTQEEKISSSQISQIEVSEDIVKAESDDDVPNEICTENVLENENPEEKCELVQSAPMENNEPFDICESPVSSETENPSEIHIFDSGVSEVSSNSSETFETSLQPEIDQFPSVQLLKSKFEEPLSLNQEVQKTEEEKAQEPHKEAIDTLPTLVNVNSDKVETSLATFTDSEKVAADNDEDNDADCELDGESLSSSTSTESFEFAESVPSPTSPESTQAIRNSIIERYPASGETDDEELDSVDDFDDDLLAVKQISAEVEQLVAAINAFGRDEEQQMSAYLVGKNMAAEKKRKMDASRSDQLVQTDTDFILVDRHLPEIMESLQTEIDRLQADLNTVKLGEKELQKLNAKLQEELQESQQTIDGIEVEAEQQYTELTSEIDELCEIVLKKDQELASIKEKVANLSVSEINLKDDVDAQRVIVQRQKEIIEGLREEIDTVTKKLTEVTKSRDKAIEDVTIYKMKNMERDRFLSKEAQMSMEIEDLQRELNKQKLILNNTSMAKLADTFDRKVLHLENELRERDMLICKQNQIINSHRKSPTGSIITQRKMPRASVLAAAGNLNSAGSSSESFQNGLDFEAKEALLSFILSDRHNQLANIYNIGRILDLSPQEERAVERHLTKDRFS